MAGKTRGMFFEKSVVFETITATIQNISTNNCIEFGGKSSSHGAVVMSDMGSVTHWIHQLKASERAVVQDLWERYFHRLVDLARRELQTVPRTAADEEDVAISAFHSFCRAVEGARFPKLDDRHDVWQILIMITRRKAISQKQYEGREMRDFRISQHLQAFSDESMADPAFMNLISKEPDPPFVAEMVDQCQFLLDKLGDEQLRLIACRKMEGFTNSEIAEELNLAQSTVERRLQLIRKIWQDELPPG